MKTLVVLIVFQIFSVSLILATDTTTIKIKGKGYNYIVTVPFGWDTIPSDTLQSRFGKGLFDVGLYESKNNNYFDGKYIQYVFMPTRNTLNQFSFEQISKEAHNNVDVANKQPQTGKIRLTTNSIISDRDNHLIFINGKIISETKERNYAQIILLTKFGFLKIMQYEAKGTQAAKASYNDLLATVKIPNDLQYIEPSSKFKLNIWHIIIAFAIGLLVYFGIQYAPNVKQLLTKK